MTPLSSMIHVYNGIHLGFRLTVMFVRSRQHTHKNGSHYIGCSTITTDEFTARHALTTVHTHPGLISTPFTGVLYQHTGRITLACRELHILHSNNQWAIPSRHALTTVRNSPESSFNSFLVLGLQRRTSRTAHKQLDALHSHASQSNNRR